MWTACAFHQFEVSSLFEFLWLHVWGRFVLVNCLALYSNIVEFKNQSCFGSGIVFRYALLKLRFQPRWHSYSHYQPFVGPNTTWPFKQHSSCMLQKMRVPLDHSLIISHQYSGAGRRGNIKSAVDYNKGKVIAAKKTHSVRIGCCQARANPSICQAMYINRYLDEDQLKRTIKIQYIAEPNKPQARKALTTGRC